MNPFSIAWDKIKAYIIGGIAFVGAAALGVLYVMFRLARRHEAEAEAERDQALQAAANAETQTAVTTQATQAAESVRQKPDTPIDTETRNDFDSTW